MLVLVYFCLEFNIKCVCLCVGTTMRKMGKKPLLVRITPQCCRISAAANRQSSHTHETHTAFSLIANSRASTHSEHKHWQNDRSTQHITKHTSTGNVQHNIANNELYMNHNVLYAHLCFFYCVHYSFLDVKSIKCFHFHIFLNVSWIFK